MRTETDIYGDTRTYNEEGHCIHFVSSDGKTEWEKEYNGLYLSHYKNNLGCEIWYTHDDKGNLIHLKDSKGYEFWRTITETDDENGYNYSVHSKDTTGHDLLEEYDRKGYNTHYKNAQTGIEYWWDSTGRQIMNPNFDG